jgi:hypothetical protein
VGRAPVEQDYLDALVDRLPAARGVHLIGSAAVGAYLVLARAWRYVEEGVWSTKRQAREWAARSR